MKHFTEYRGWLTLHRVEFESGNKVWLLPNICKFCHGDMGPIQIFR